MVLYPEAQRRAQSEIDKVLRHGQLPNFGDRETLPYTDCLMQEVLRYVTMM